jgi:hypothetical protein
LGAHPLAAGAVVIGRLAGRYLVVACDHDPEFTCVGKGPSGVSRAELKSIVVSALAILAIAWAIDMRGALALIVAGPLVGAILDAARGGNGIVGGMLAGAVTFCGFAATLYVRACFFAEPNAIDYLGPALAFPVMAVMGMVIGAIVGFAHGLFVDRR